MMGDSGQSLPKQCGCWKDLKAAYRLLSNPAVDPQAIGLPHRRRTLAACAAHPVVLCVQDTTNLDLTRKTAMQGLGPLGDGSLRGLLQHSGLAVVPHGDDQPWDQAPGQLLGILHQQWATRSQPPAGETLRQLQQRRTDADVWQETAEAVAQLGPTPARLIHVGDRHSDIFRFFDRCRHLHHGFVVRARYDRAVCHDDGPDPGERLWATVRRQPEVGRRVLTVHEQRTAKGQQRCKARRTTLALRYATVTIDPPINDPRTAEAELLTCQVVLVQECDPPPGAEPLNWLLLTSEPLATVADAWRLVGYYRHRWLIEEWHRVLKEGCRLEQAQFDQALDVQRLAAIKAVMAVRLLQLRDLAQAAGDDTRRLQQAAPRRWILVVAQLARVPADQLTPAQFYLTIAQRGGYLARKHDPRPGWKVLWRGWHDIDLMVQGLELAHSGCG